MLIMWWKMSRDGSELRAGSASVSLLSAAAFVEYLQAGLKGGRAFFFFVCFGRCIFTFAFLPECVGGRGCQAPVYSRWQRLWYAHNQDGRVGGLDFFVRFRPCIFPFTFLRVCGGARVQASLYSRPRRLGYAQKLDGRAGARRFFVV